MYHAIIFTGIDRHPNFYYKSLGAYRIRTELEYNGYSVKVIDYFHQFTDELIEKAFNKFVTKETLWVGFSTTFFDCNTQLDDRNKFFSNLKKQFNVKIVVGGAKSLLGKFEFADYVISGHADDSIVNLTNDLYNDVSNTKYRSLLNRKIIDSNLDYDRSDLSNIPVLWKEEDYLNANIALPIEIARGCIFNCAFCNYPMNNKTKFDYIRHKESIRSEMIRNYELFGTTKYQFMDDTYNDSMEKLKWMHDVISSLPFKITFDAYIKPELLVRWPEQIDYLIESGLRGASLGVESYHPKARQSIQKMTDIDRILSSIEQLKIKSNGSVKTQVGLIVGLPYEDEKNLLLTQQLVRDNENIDFWNWWPLQIHDKNSFEYHSPIDKDPQKFGYQVSIPIHSNFKNMVITDTIYWENELMNVYKATEISEQLMKEDAPYKKVGGWLCGSVESLGISVDSFFNSTGGFIKDLPFEQMKNEKVKIIKSYIKKILY
jgi:hypothetical protein